MRQITFLVSGMLFIFGCCKNSVEPKVTDPKQALLGRWEEIENNLGPVNNPSGYDEYLPDSVRKSYSYADKIFYYEKYWLEDSLLIRSFKYVDPYDNYVKVFKWRYRYEYLSYNKIKLVSQNPSIIYSQTYKRIK